MNTGSKFLCEQNFQHVEWKDTLRYFKLTLIELLKLISKEGNENNLFSKSVDTELDWSGSDMIKLRHRQQVTTNSQTNYKIYKTPTNKIEKQTAKV